MTATPHSGHQDAFASLVGLLNPSFEAIALAEHPSENDRRKLARHIVQRRRPDIRRDFDDLGTTFPERDEATLHFTLDTDRSDLFRDVLDWGRTRLNAVGEDRRRFRVREWSLLGLLRAMASSPAAAVAGLKTRAESLEHDTALETKQARLDEVVFDRASETGLFEEVMGVDELADEGEEDILAAFINRFEALDPRKDPKYVELVNALVRLIEEGHNPIVFCRFVPTVDMLATLLADEPKLKRARAHIEGITGRFSPDERVRRIDGLHAVADRPRIRVATDCLSEGINLQEHFDAVVHYDLSWSPTNHEQREGRVDRFGQPKPTVKALSLVGRNNIIDAHVAQIIIEKQKTIRQALGISVPAPDARDAIAEAILNGEIRPRGSSTLQTQLFEYDSDMGDMHIEWTNAATRESNLRSRFAQSTIRVDEVQTQVASVRKALGSPKDVHRFLLEAFNAYGVVPEYDAEDDFLGLEAVTSLGSEALRNSVQLRDHERLAVVDDRSPVPLGWQRIVRTSSIVEQLADLVMGAALDPKGGGIGRRLSVTRTNEVGERTFLVLARGRFTLKAGGRETPMLVEDLLTLAFTGTGSEPTFLASDEVERLWTVVPSGNVPPGQAAQLLNGIIPDLRGQVFSEALSQRMKVLGEHIVAAHQSVRNLTSGSRIAFDIQPHEPVDLLSLNVLLPGGGR